MSCWWKLVVMESAPGEHNLHGMSTESCQSYNRSDCVIHSFNHLLGITQVNAYHQTYSRDRPARSHLGGTKQTKTGKQPQRMCKSMPPKLRDEYLCSTRAHFQRRVSNRPIQPKPPKRENACVLSVYVRHVCSGELLHIVLMRLSNLALHSNNI